MKKIITMSVLALMLASCSSNTEVSTEVKSDSTAVVVDTAKVDSNAVVATATVVTSNSVAVTK